MRYLSLFFCLCLSCAASAQSNYVVEKVLLTNTVDNESKSAIPRLKDTANPKNPVVTKVNESLMDRFMINSFNQRELEEFRWSDIEFRSEIKNSILFITFTGEYYGAYPNVVEEEIFFDLTTGSLLKNHDIPFQALFNLKGYFDFLNKFWLPAVKPLFAEANTCADSEPYCSYYDISRYDYGSNNSFTFSLESDCFPHAMMACAPTYSRTIPGDSIKPYLSDFGKTVLINNRYSQLGGVAKYEFNKKIESQIPDMIFLTGKIGGKYEFSMALRVNRSTHKADGYYYYEKKKIPITLTGEAGTNSIQLQESSNGKVTGKMSFTISTEYNEKAFSLYETDTEKMIYVMGTWKSPDDKTSMEIIISEIKTTTGIH